MMANKRLPPWQDRMLILRIAVCFSLIATAVLLSFGSYYFLHQSQQALQHGEYIAVASKIESTTQQDTARSQHALQNQAATTSFLFPNASTWPYHAIPLSYWDAMTTPLIQMARTRAVALAPIITPEEVPAFEQFAYRWLAESGHPELGISWFGKGIYAVNASTGERYHDVNGSFGVSHGQNRILTPVIEIANLSYNAPAIMYNLYSEMHRIDAIDHSIACARASNGTEQAASTCSDITDVIFLVQDIAFRPASLITYPVQVENTTVAIAYAVQNWDTILQDGINSKVTGIDMVLAYGTQSYYTFTTVDGKVKYVGPGDLHDRKYDDRGYSFQTTPYGGPEVFFVHIYPTDSWVNTYENDLPGIICGVTVAIIVLTSLLFFFYDYLMSRAAHESALVLDTKRQFVRYISHEIRTPLNIVQLGFKLLYSEIFTFRAGHYYQTIPEKKPAAENANLPPNAEVPAADIPDDILKDWLGLITDIADSADVAISVLNDLINFDKLHMGTLHLEVETLPIWDIIAPAVQPFLIQARHSGVILTTDLQVERHEPALHFYERQILRKQIVFGDSNKLSQVIRNLVSNALKFTPSGGEVRIEAHWSPDGLPQTIAIPEAADHVRCGSIVMTVSDNGAGMSAENLHALFQEGVQFQANQLQAGQGSGLGLWIAKGIVNMHHGTLTAASPGEHLGSTFTLELPVFKSTHPDLPCVSDVENQGEVRKNGGMTSSLHGHDVDPSSLLGQNVQDSSRIRNILVTDDSALNRKMLCRLLRTAGYVCYEACDGQDCVDKVMASQGEGQQPEITRIDVILMDYEMPRMNGPTATSVLRSLGCRLPIIGITGNVLNEDRDLFLDKGACKVLTKPISLSQLREILTELQADEQPDESADRPSECKDAV